MYGGTTREDPKYPGILSILDTVCSAPKIGFARDRAMVLLYIPGSPVATRDTYGR